MPELGADRDYLLALWQKIQGTSERARAPAQIHQDLSPLLRAVRDMFTEAIQEAWVDDEESFREILDFLDQTDPSLVPRVKLFRRNTDLMAEFGIDRELEKAMRPKVWLKSGGYLVVNQTEALVAIDVNTGKFVGTTSLEDTVFRSPTSRRCARSSASSACATSAASWSSTSSTWRRPTTAARSTTPSPRS